MENPSPLTTACVEEYIVEPIRPPSNSPLVLPPSSVFFAGKTGGENLFQTNERVIATVLAMMDGEVLLDIAGTQVAAATKRSLAPGQELSLQVRATSPQIELQILDAPLDEVLSVRLASLLRQDVQPAQLARTIFRLDAVQSLDFSAETSQVLGRMQELLHNSGIPTPQLLKEWQNLLGLDLETQLASKSQVTFSLKTALLEIAARTAPMGSLAGKMLPLVDRLLAGSLPLESLEAQTAIRDALGTMAYAKKSAEREVSPLEIKLFDMLEALAKKSASHSGKDLPAEIVSQLQELRELLAHAKDLAADSTLLLQKLETFQLLQMRFNQEATIFLPFFLSFLTEGYLLVDGRENGRAATDDTSLRLSLLLAIQGLGDMRVDLFRDTTGVSIRFLLDSRDKALFVAGFQDELKQAFTELPILGLSFDAGAPPPQQTLVRRAFAADSSKNLLDSRV